MTLPTPDRTTSQKKTKGWLVTLAIAFWALVISGVFAGLIVTVGSANGDKKDAAALRQGAYKELLPALELVDTAYGDNREIALLEALEIIDGKVLEIDPKHPLAIQTKDEIQFELAEMQSNQISDQERTIQEQLDDLRKSEAGVTKANAEIKKAKSEIEKRLAEIEDAQNDIERLNAQLKGVEKINGALNREKQQLSNERQQLITDKNNLNAQLRKNVQDYYNKLNSKDREIVSLKKKVDQLTKELRAEKLKQLHTFKVAS
ncbi:MAG: hypothetical protein P1U89_15895 [Verrucomicrobiales bacterium]|nr:hypothetical protein [Verrucomicrobiales bacterium]